MGKQRVDTEIWGVWCDKSEWSAWQKQLVSVAKVSGQCGKAGAGLVFL